ncbi:MAG: hypothetical protein HYX84_06020 [Chloroflexi bacterium]|nr:hypothetical protein [Chloroflexota bacterium]
MRNTTLEGIFLYDDGIAGTVDMDIVSIYLREKLGAALTVEARGNPFASCPGKIPAFARKLASIKLRDIHRSMTPAPEPLYGEVQFEERKILGKTKAFGIIYEGLHLMRIYADLIPSDERRVSQVHIFLTNRLFATWAEDRRYHARTSLYGFPSIISTSGLVEAPAKPKEYYQLKQQYEMFGRDLLELNERFKGRFLDYDDTRMTQVVKGYVMQAVFYALTSDPFCEDRGCKLFNAHWQEDLLHAQIENQYDFCERHEKVLRNVRSVY